MYDPIVLESSSLTVVNVIDVCEREPCHDL